MGWVGFKYLLCTHSVHGSILGMQGEAATVKHSRNSQFSSRNGHMKSTSASLWQHREGCSRVSPRSFHIPGFPISDQMSQFLQNHINPALDFTQTPPGMLALDNMLYLAKFHQDTYIRVRTGGWPLSQCSCLPLRS
jgi:hypothetical protein